MDTPSRRTAMPPGAPAPRSRIRSVRSARRRPTRRRCSLACGDATSGRSTTTNSFVQVGASHIGHSFTQAGSNPTFAGAGAISTSRLRFENPAYIHLRRLDRDREGRVERDDFRGEPQQLERGPRSPARTSSSSNRRRCDRGCWECHSATSSSDRI